MTRTVRFTKMHGAGNDYIYVYLPECPISDPARCSIAWSKPHVGVGSDGLILVGKGPLPAELRRSTAEADFSMRIFNNDGSEAMMCGNGVRCVAKFVRDRGLTTASTIRVDTLSGVKVIDVYENGQGEVTSARVDMGRPLLSNPAQCATHSGSLRQGILPGTSYQGTYVCMGNPHFVTFVNDVLSLDLPAIGPQLEHHSLFPERCNIEFAQKRADGSVRMRVWERGSGITMACGTGACATAVATLLSENLPTGTVNVEMDGGTLSIEWAPDGHIYMTGPAARVFEGTLTWEEE